MCHLCVFRLFCCPLVAKNTLIHYHSYSCKDYKDCNIWISLLSDFWLPLSFCLAAQMLILFDWRLHKGALSVGDTVLCVYCIYM